jgi:putative component of membrane protein insertase Oxa1/YidC/SpoIIIJ protein YidD
MNGLVLTAKRLIRCRGSMKKLDKSAGKTWGYDPVPNVNNVEQKKLYG